MLFLDSAFVVALGRLLVVGTIDRRWLDIVIVIVNIGVSLRYTKFLVYTLFLSLPAIIASIQVLVLVAFFQSIHRRRLACCSPTLA